MSKAGSIELKLSKLASFKKSQALRQDRRLTIIRRGKNGEYAERVIVLVHGLWSGAKTWEDFVSAAYENSDLDGYDFAVLNYKTSYINKVLPFVRKIDGEDWARVLADILEHSLLSRGRYEQIVLVGHSMGGIIAKLAIRDLVLDGKELLLKKIHSVFTYATPHYGSDRAFLPGSLLSSDIAFLRRNGKAVESLRRFWSTRVGPGRDFQIHERAFVSAKDEVVAMSSAAGGMSQNHIFHLVTSHTEIHRPENGDDRRIAWFCRELELIDRKGKISLAEIRKMPSSDSMFGDAKDFIERLFESVFVFDAGSAEGIEEGDELAICYETRLSANGGILPASPWHLMRAGSVREHESFASMRTISYEPAFDRFESSLLELGISDDDTPSPEQFAQMVRAMFGSHAIRIPAEDTNALKLVKAAVDRGREETPGSDAWHRALRDVLSTAEEFRREREDSIHYETVSYEEAYATLFLGRLEEAEDRFEKFIERFPFSVSVLGARGFLEEIRLRLYADKNPDNIESALRLGTYLMGYGNHHEGVSRVRDAVLREPKTLGGLKAGTRVELFVALVGEELLQNRFANKDQIAEWMSILIQDEKAQSQVQHGIESIREEGYRSLLLDLSRNVFQDWQSITAS